MTFRDSIEKHVLGAVYGPDQGVAEQAQLTDAAELEARLLRAELVALLASMFKHGTLSSEGLTALGHAEGVLADTRHPRAA